MPTASKRTPASTKPAKPYPDFPLFPHATRRWAKKIRGQMHYFGSWANGPDAALAKYLAEKDDLHAGRKPRVQVSEGVTVKALVNAFLNHKQTRLDNGELSSRTWRTYKETTDVLVQQFGKQRLASDLDPDDFAKLRDVAAKRWGLHRLATFIQYTR